MLAGAAPGTLCQEGGIPVSALDAETTDQRVEYACPRCDGVVAEDDTVCPHCGQQLEAVAGEEEELLVAPANTEAVAARPVNPLSLEPLSPLSLVGVFVGVIVGLLLLVVAVLLALVGVVGVLVSGLEVDIGGVISGFFVLGLAIGLGAAGVSLLRRARRAWEGDQNLEAVAAEEGEFLVSSAADEEHPVVSEGTGPVAIVGFLLLAAAAVLALYTLDVVFAESPLLGLSLLGISVGLGVVAGWMMIRA
jgi:hypothetical protein